MEYHFKTSRKDYAMKLRILMVSPQFRPIVGGYERAAELSAELVRLGHEVTVITERRDRSWPAREQQDGVWSGACGAFTGRIFIILLRLRYLPCFSLRKAGVFMFGTFTNTARMR